MIVVDASVLVVALGSDDQDGDHARARLRGQRLAAPDLVDLEVVSAWRRQHAAGLMDDRRAAQAIGDLEVLPMDRSPHRHLLARCWELRDNLTVYDAAYVALAELWGATLLTADARIAGAPGVTCAVDVLGG